MNVLVTGATGFIGRHLARALERAGHNVIAAQRQPAHSAPYIQKHLHADFSHDHEPAVWLPRLHGIDAVINTVGITGIGSAYYMLFASLSGDARITAHVVKQVVRADCMFTTPTIVLQPLTGFYLIHLTGYPLTLRWIWGSIALYLLAGACWLPVVWMQIRMHALAEAAAHEGVNLPSLYRRYLQWWVALGTVAFFALIIVFYLMVVKPA